MKIIAKTPQEIELHQIDDRFSPGRLLPAREVAAMAHALSREGQQVAVISVIENGRFVLVDGYLRLAGAKQCGWDSLYAEVWDCDLFTAMGQVMRANQSRRWDPVEEGYLLAELIESGLERSQVAGLVGRDPSWVSRRLALVAELPDEVLASVKAGALSSWTASRVLAPMARANPMHAKQLLSGLQREGLSTRDVAQLYKHYQKASKAQRDKMTEDPGLFVAAMKARENNRNAAKLGEGPEGKLTATAKQIGGLMSRFRQQAQHLLGLGDGDAMGAVQFALDEVDRQWSRIRNELQRSCHESQRTTEPDPGATCPELPDSADQQNTESKPEHGAQSPEGSERERRATPRIAGFNRGNAENLQALSRQRGTDQGSSRGGIQTRHRLFDPDSDPARGSPSNSS